MPVITVNMWKGRTVEEKRKLVKEVIFPLIGGLLFLWAAPASSLGWFIRVEDSF